MDPVTGRKGSGAVGQKWRVRRRRDSLKILGVEVGDTVKNLQGVEFRKEV